MIFIHVLFKIDEKRIVFQDSYKKQLKLTFGGDGQLESSIIERWKSRFPVAKAMQDVVEENQ